MYWDDVGFLHTSELSFKILTILHVHTQPLTPKQIAKLTKIARSNVSTKLIKLRERNLVQCITPERKKGRLYKLTRKGKYVVKLATKSKSLKVKPISI